MGNKLGQLPLVVIEHITELVLTEFYKELRSKEVLRSIESPLKNGAMIDYRFLLRVIRTQSRRVTLEMIDPTLKRGEPTLKRGAFWRAMDPQRVRLRLNDRYYGAKKEIMLQIRNRKIPKIAGDGLWGWSLLEIQAVVEKEVEEVQKHKEEFTEQQWLKVGKKTVDVTELVDKWKRKDSWRKDIIWAIQTVFDAWVSKINEDNLRTTEPVQVGKDRTERTKIYLTLSNWWVVNITNNYDETDAEETVKKQEL